MKNAFLLLCSALVSLLILGQTVVLSQEPNSEPNESFDEAYKKYKDELEIYRSAHEVYLFKKAQYERFGTLTSRQEAQAATASMLETRDDVVISYLLALRSRLSEAIGVGDSTKEDLGVGLDAEIGWWLDHKDTIPTAGTLEDLEKDSSEAEVRWKGVEPLAYETLAEVSRGRILSYSDRTDEVFVRVKDKIGQIRNMEKPEYSFGTEKFDVLDRWVFEVDGRIVRSKERQSDAEEEISSLTKKRTNALSSYNGIVTILGETQLYLKEANTFMKEIVREIKTAE